MKETKKIISIKKGEGNMNNEIIIPEGKKEEQVNAIRYCCKITRAIDIQLCSIVKRFDNHVIRTNAKMNRIFIIAKDGAIEATLTLREIQALSNMCYQINNGGISQWRFNGFSVSDRAPLIRALNKMNMNELKNRVYGAGRSEDLAWLYDLEIWKDLEHILEKITEIQKV